MKKKLVALAAGLAVAALTLVGCSSDAAPAADSNASAAADGDTRLPEMTTVTFGMTPSASHSIMMLGINQGFFEEQNLKLEYVDAPTGDAMIQGLVSNTINFGPVNPVSFAVAADKNLPVKLTTNIFSSAPEFTPGYAGTYVLPDSPIQDWADISGMKVQVPSLASTGELYIRAAIDNNGGDSSTNELVVLSSADAVPALEQGLVDVISIPGTYVHTAEQAGLRLIGDHVHETADGQNTLPVAVNSVWGSQNLDVVRAFNAAVAKSVEYALANDGELRQTMVDEFPQSIPDLDAANNFHIYPSSCFNETSQQILFDYMSEYEMVERAEWTEADLYLEGIEVPIC